MVLQRCRDGCCPAHRRHLFGLRLRFEDDEMEAHYQLRSRVHASQLCYLWCAMEFVFFTALLLVRGWRYELWAKPEVMPFVQQGLPLILLAVLAAAVRLVRPLGRYARPLLCLVACALVAIILWTASDMIGRDAAQHRSQISQVWAAMNKDPLASSQLLALLNLLDSRVNLSLAVIQVTLLFNLLLFLGLTLGTFCVFLSLPIMLVMFTFLSPTIANRLPEIIFYSFASTLFALCACFQMTNLQRHRFEMDYTLQATLKREANAMREMAQRERALKEASAEADSILNHILKNVMADTAGCIFLFLEQTGRSPPEELQQAMRCLERGMGWCRKRQAMMRITAGDYVPLLTPVNLREFGESLLQGRNLACRFIDEMVFLDPILCDIVLDNAINNALRHGDSTLQPVGFTMELEPEESSAEPDVRRLTFEVTNRALQDRPPLTAHLVDEILTGQQQADICSVLSEHLGLKHLYLAAQIHNMDLSLKQTGDLITLRAVLLVNACGSFKQAIHAVAAQCDPLPDGLKILCIDDSDVARRVLYHIFKRHASKADIRILGEVPEDVQRFKEEALRGANLLLLDNHLTYGPAHFLGRELLEELVARGYRGFACIRSADASAEDRALYLQSGAHCVVGKDVPPQEMILQIRAAYADFVSRRGPPNSQSQSLLPLSASHDHNLFLQGSTEKRLLPLPG